LHRQIAFLDREIRPRRLNERVLRDQRSGTLNQYVKQRDRTCTQGNGFGVPEKDLALYIETKRTECVNGRDCAALPFGKLSETLRATFTT